MYQAKGRILANKKLGEGHYLMRLEAPQIAEDARPGQFVHVRCGSGHDPLLRRPFSIYKCDPGRIEILYQVVGRGTGLLSQKRGGDQLDVIGPLGEGFEIKLAFGKILIVSGGMGVAPLYMVAQEIVGQGEKVKEVTALIGARNKQLILGKKDMESLGVRVMIATEDGSEGYPGLVSDLLEKVILSEPWLSLAVYACGPVSMLRKIAELSFHRRFFCQVSLEQRMGCGLGACLGCVIRGRAGYVRVCKEGPVFNTQEIIWNDPGLQIK